jgi:hypothetical protein
MNVATNTCSVCCEKFTKLARSPVECGYCPKDSNFKACSACVKRYLLETNQNAHCMNCKNAWNRTVLCSFLPKIFINETYRLRRQNLLEERERSMMPATQPYVELELMRKDHREMLRELDKYRFRFINPITNAHNYYYSDAFLERKIYVVKKEHEIEVFYKTIRETENRLNLNSKQNEHYMFVRQCPSENCRGFLSSSWKCGLCKVVVCNKCHEIKTIESEKSEEGTDNNTDNVKDSTTDEANNDTITDEPQNKNENKHICNLDMVETAKLLARDSKPCPKCASLIFKIEGCDQMFCTQCHTGFSWKTGRIERGIIHNPHYFEYLREQNNGGDIPRNPLDNPCGEFGIIQGIAFTNDLTRYILQKYRFFRDIRIPYNSKWVLPSVQISNEIQLCNHIADPGNKCIIPENTDQDSNRDIRIQYMMHKITENVFKQTLQIREKKNEKAYEYDLIYRTYVMAARDLILNHVNLNEYTDKSFEEMFLQLHKLKEYINECFLKLKPVFSCKVPFITETCYIENR